MVEKQRQTGTQQTHVEWGWKAAVSQSDIVEMKVSRT